MKAASNRNSLKKKTKNKKTENKKNKKNTCLGRTNDLGCARACAIIRVSRLDEFIC